MSCGFETNGGRSSSSTDVSACIVDRRGNTSAT